MKKNFYIIAMGRSGTTLLQNLLDSHPNVVVPPESFFVLHLQRKYGKVKDWNDKMIVRFIDDLYTDRPFRIFWRVEKNELLKSFSSFGVISSFSDACNAVRSSYREGYKKESLLLIGDKNPIYSRFTSRIMKVNKDAKIIHMVRDPRGNARGQIKTFKRKDPLAIGYLWTKYNRSILSLSVKYPQQYFVLKYEDLVMEPERTMRVVCDFLEIEFKQEMFDYRTSLESRFEDYSDKLIGKHQNLLKPIDKNLLDNWRRDLDQDQIKRVEYTTHKIAKQMGYSFAKPKTDIRMSLWMPFAKGKILLRFALLDVYFSIPINWRKLILKIRSKRSDHKYWTSKSNN